jgi:hypothetical protein
MSALSTLLKPLARAAAAFFKHDLTVRREGEVVRVVLEQRPAVPSKRDRREQDERRKANEEVALIRSELAALLNQLPETRRTMRHLVFVEQALAKKGLRALHKIPLDVLQHALAQLEGLVLNWSPAGLANLRSKMAVAVLDREHHDPDAEADAYRTAAVLDSAPAPRRATGGLAAPESPEQTVIRSEDEALAAAYAALGAMSPDTQSGVEMQGELGSPSARALGRAQTRVYQPAPGIEVRELHS